MVGTMTGKSSDLSLEAHRRALKRKFAGLRGKLVVVRRERGDSSPGETDFEHSWTVRPAGHVSPRPPRFAGPEATARADGRET